MVYRQPHAAPRSAVEDERRGRTVGRFCRACGSIYPRFAARHCGKPMYGRDHVASPCTHEDDEFVAGAAWWEPAVEILPATEPPGEDS